MPNRRRGGALPDPEDVLSGRAHVDVRALMRLIHAVNPTGRTMRPDNRERRYGLKSRLQSLLVAEYADDLEVVRDASDENLVTLRHRVLGDGCHARITDLDDDARSWVQLQLDLAAWDDEQRVK
jgi:hypothetical protein